jgi:uncharacterized protein
MADGAQIILLGLAAAAGGAVNALAGGGTLLTFPALLAAGLPPVTANVTSTVALCPGYLGAALAQRADLRGEGRMLRRTAPAALAGGLAGGLLLMASGDRVFGALVPYLILIAAGLLAAQEPLRARLQQRETGDGSAVGVVPAVAATAVYGGYFGAGASVVLLAALGLTVDAPLRRLNALKQALALTANVAAAVLFAARGPVAWGIAPVMAAAALGGGMVGGWLARRMSPRWLRLTMVSIGASVGILYLLR